MVLPMWIYRIRGKPYVIPVVPIQDLRENSPPKLMQSHRIAHVAVASAGWPTRNDMPESLDRGSHIIHVRHRGLTPIGSYGCWSSQSHDTQFRLTKTTMEICKRNLNKIPNQITNKCNYTGIVVNKGSVFLQVCVSKVGLPNSIDPTHTLCT